MKWTLKSEAETLAFGGALFEAINQSTVDQGGMIYLEGDLGAGKTTLVRGFLRAGGHAGVVKSPTYTLVEEYQLGQRTLFHFDLYRLADPEELEWIGIRDYLQQNPLIFVEWPQCGVGWLPPYDAELQLKMVNEGRVLTLKTGSELGKMIEDRLKKTVD